MNRSRHLEELARTEPWEAIADHAVAQYLEAELSRETPLGHGSVGQTVHEIARRQDREDVLYEVGSGTCVVVHLTHRVEGDPRWPTYSAYRSAAEPEDRLRQVRSVPTEFPSGFEGRRGRFERD